MAFYHKLAMHQRLAEAGAKKRQATKLERIQESGRMDKEVALALGKLRGKREIDLEKLRQKFKAPVMEAELQKALFDLEMGREYTPGLLAAKTAESRMYADYLRKKMDELTAGGAELPVVTPPEEAAKEAPPIAKLPPKADNLAARQRLQIMEELRTRKPAALPPAPTAVLPAPTGLKAEAVPIEQPALTSNIPEPKVRRTKAGQAFEFPFGEIEVGPSVPRPKAAPKKRKRAKPELLLEEAFTPRIRRKTTTPFLYMSPKMKRDFWEGRIR